MSDLRNQYCIDHIHGNNGDWWRIRHAGGEEVLFQSPFLLEHWGLAEPPLIIQREYERLIQYDPSATRAFTPNVVEILADEEDCAFDQPCLYGYRVENYKVYCHNNVWLYAPSVCHRSLSYPHAQCPGFKENK